VENTIGTRALLLAHELFEAFRRAAQHVVEIADGQANAFRLTGSPRGIDDRDHCPTPDVDSVRRELTIAEQRDAKPHRTGHVAEHRATFGHALV